ncbi:histidine--tRNA ligase [Mycoplasmopsis citelli]|uniref:histidine--tRNA ligase n=1 Tax=Mycoplasmopsis citelli TaxID=171281 RepID=UPI002113AF01|nr:histidine--tRNA ligase [Mycoplasmopsis citelli]UUD36475.1 histidine--tRNA ligase [Mycoplasmopsis citelli]
MINKVKGTIDYSIGQYTKKRAALSIFEYLVEKFGFSMIETPILEYAELFKRTNQNSDMVQKEMFTFVDKGGREIVLRPEGTASFVRAFVNNKWYAQSEIDKFAYWGPMFRYERPQSGRYRQFYQAGVEYVGDKNPYKDAHVIFTGQLLMDFFAQKAGKKVELKINSIGDEQTRIKYQEALKEFLLPYKDQLSEISQQRLASNNVLRILDDKVDSKLPFMKNAPQISHFYSPESKKYFQDVLDKLDLYEFKYKIDPNLVRGLDYYDEIVFEFIGKTNQGETTLIGGGRYSDLIEELGGPKLSSVGFGFGVDRIIEFLGDLLDDTDNTRIVPNLGFVDNRDILIGASEKASVLENLYSFYLGLNFEGDNFKMTFVPELTKSKKLFEMAKKQNVRFLLYEDPKISNPDIVVLKDLVKNKKIELDLLDMELASNDLYGFIIKNT